MGFHRRYVTEESILEAYKTDKIKGICVYLKADSYIFNSQWVSEVITLYSDNNYDELEKLIKARINEEKDKDNC